MNRYKFKYKNLLAPPAYTALKPILDELYGIHTLQITLSNVDHCIVIVETNKPRYEALITVNFVLWRLGCLSHSQVKN